MRCKRLGDAMHYVLLVILLIVGLAVGTRLLASRRQPNPNTAPINLTPRQAARNAVAATPVVGGGSAQNNPNPTAARRRNRFVGTLNRRWTGLTKRQKSVFIWSAIGAVAVLALMLKTMGPHTGKAGKTSPEISAQAEYLANAIVNSAIEVERTTNLKSAPYDAVSTPEERLRYDPFNLGDDPSSKKSAQEAWVKITKQAPREFMNKHHNFERETLKEYVRLAVVVQLQNGLTVGQVIDGWPKEIKNWKSDARIADPAGWKYASQYSDSLRVTYQRSYEGKAYGLDTTAKSLISPKLIAARPRTRGDSWLAAILSVALYGIFFVILSFGRTNNKKFFQNHDVWSLAPATIAALLICWAAISRNVQADQAYRTFHVWGWTVLIGWVIWAVERQLYEDHLPAIKKK